LSSNNERKGIYKEVSVDSVVEPVGRHRMEINEEEIQELMDSIESWGLRQAIEVVKRDDKYEIVYGERRWLAHKKLRKKKIFVKVVELSREEIILVRATENIPRSNLTAVEEAAVFAELRDEFELTPEQIAKKVGMKVGTVKRRMDILKMPAEFQKAIHKKTVSNTVAEELWRCPNEAHRLYLLDLAIDHGITAVIARQWVNDYLKSMRSMDNVDSEGGGDHSPLEVKPSYQACDICSNAVDLNEMIHLGICRDCKSKLNGALK